MAIRKTRHLAALLAAALACAPHASGAIELELPAPGEPTTAMVTGKGYRFLLLSPKGWVLDTQGGAGRGLAAVLFPLGSTFKDAPAVLYVNVAPRAGGEALDAFVAREIARAQGKSPGLKVEAGQPVETQDRKRAEVRAVTGDPWRNREALAFIREAEAFVIVVLSARSAESYEAALPAFRELVRSYSTIGPDVKVLPQPPAPGQSSG